MTRLSGYLTEKEVKSIEGIIGLTVDKMEKMKDSENTYFVELDTDWTIMEFLEGAGCKLK